MLADQRGDIDVPFGMVTAQVLEHDRKLDGIAQAVAEFEQNVGGGRRRRCGDDGSGFCCKQRRRVAVHEGGSFVAHRSRWSPAFRRSAVGSQFGFRRTA